MSLVIATMAWIWQYFRLIQDNLPNSVYGQMFRQNVWIGFILLGGMIGGSLLK